MVDDTKSPAGPSAQRRAADRRTQPRYQFTADAELIDPAAPPNVEPRDVYVYFDNDAKVRAPVDARSLRAKLADRS